EPLGEAQVALLGNGHWTGVAARKAVVQPDGTRVVVASVVRESQLGTHAVLGRDDRRPRRHWRPRLAAGAPCRRTSWGHRRADRPPRLRVTGRRRFARQRSARGSDGRIWLRRRGDGDEAALQQRGQVLDRVRYAALPAELGNGPAAVDPEESRQGAALEHELLTGVRLARGVSPP